MCGLSEGMGKDSIMGNADWQANVDVRCRRRHRCGKYCRPATSAAAQPRECPLFPALFGNSLPPRRAYDAWHG